MPMTAIQEKAFFGSKQNKMAAMQERMAVTRWLMGNKKGNCSITMLIKTKAPPAKSKNMHPAKSNLPGVPKAM